jgi:TetR/AcrR family transcriptional regulator, transcriptional repressor for nem operon
MRYGKNHREQTRSRILDVAAQQFRERGIASSGLAGLMAAAGLTNGAFYAHFASKEDLVRDALADRPDRPRTSFVAALEAGEPPGVWIPRYLSAGHRDDPGTGCQVAALAAEIGRHSAETRAAFCERVEHVVALIAPQMPGDVPDARTGRARAVYALLVGTMQLARAAGTGPASDTVLANGIEAALTLASVPVAPARP